MKCPECSYTSFDYLEECKKCGAALSPVPVFKYLYEYELGTQTPISPSVGPDSENVSAGVEIDTTGVAFPPVSADEPGERSPSEEFEDFLRLERNLGGQSPDKTEEHSISSPLPNGMFPATFGERFLAFSIDLLATLCVACAALVSGANLIGETFFPGVSEFVSIWGWICLCVYILATTYFVFLPSWCGTTLGNATAGIRVVMRDGSLVGFRANLLRWVGWVFSVSTVFLGFALMVLDPQRKTLSDRLCGTFVVRN